MSDRKCVTISGPEAGKKTFFQFFFKWVINLRMGTIKMVDEQKEMMKSTQYRSRTDSFDTGINMMFVLWTPIRRSPSKYAMGSGHTQCAIPNHAVKRFYQINLFTFTFTMTNTVSSIFALIDNVILHDLQIKVLVVWEHTWRFFQCNTHFLREFSKSMS